MSKALIAIGVGKTDGIFSELKGAADDAREFHAWGQAQGFDCTLLVDDQDKKVRVADVYEAIEQYVRQSTYSQIIVYFSGHGVLKAPDCELWMMSGAPRNPNEVINVHGSITQARTCGIAHVVFISDACRTLPEGMNVAAVSAGQHVFPYIAWRSPVPEVDVFYATLPGDVALEAPPDENVARDRGLLTQCLLAALGGKVPQVIQATVVDGISWDIVPSRPLKDWLTSTLPLTASDISFSLQQHPDVRIESDISKYLSKLQAGAGVSSLASSSMAAAPAQSTANSRYQTQDTARRLVPSRVSFRDPSVQKSEAVFSLPTATHGVSAQHNEMAKVVGMSSAFESVRTGLVSVGGRIESATGNLGAIKVSSDTQDSWIDLAPADSSTVSQRDATTKQVALRLENGRGLVLSVFPGYIGTVILDRGQVKTVNYNPTPSSANYQDFSSFAAEIEGLRINVADAARSGRFSLESAEFESAAKFVHSGQITDLTLAMYVSYAYARAGKFAEVQEISAMLNRREVPLPFDVALLAVQSSGGPLPNLLPGMPMLTQGWLSFGRYEELLPPQLNQARQFLVPSLWATFSPDGMSILERYMHKGI